MKAITLHLRIDPSDLSTAQQKGERVVKGRFIQHYIKPKVAASARMIDEALVDQMLLHGEPVKLADVKLNGKVRKEYIALDGFKEGEPVCVDMFFNFPCRKSDSQKVKAQFSNHTQRPDLDNLAKLVLDRITAMHLIADDAQVINLRLGKVRCPEGMSPSIDLSVYGATKEAVECFKWC